MTGKKTSGAEGKTQDSPELVSMTTRVATPVSPPFDERELALAVEESRYFQALRASGSAIVVAGLDGIAQRWSAGAEKMFGYAADEVVGKSLGILITELDQKLAELPNRIRTEAKLEYELRLRRKDGALIDVDIAASAVRSHGGDVTGMTLVITDVTPLKALERRLQSLGQLEAVARVAAGFAHDLNNILTIAGTYQSFVAESSLSATQAADLKVARDAVERGAGLVDQLLALGQNRAATIVSVDLNDVARAGEETLRRVVGDQIELAVRLAPQAVTVRAAPGQLDQVLLNLALNARDAMPQGGRLTIAVRNAPIGKGHALLGELPGGTYAVLSVEDTGIGIDQTTLSRVFEPFFTTKPLGDGTGLGLLIVKDIVTQLRGTVRIETSVGQGSNFEVYLPLFEAPPYVESIRPPESVQEKKTVLVVDEDDAIRNALQRILRDEGYSVLLAADGFDATDIAARHEGPIDLLLCDLYMSREDGRQTMARIHPTRPGLRVLFVSGSPVKPGYVAEDARIMRKPFTPEVVTSMVRELLESQPVAPRALPDRPVVLVVDDSPEVRDSLLRMLSESELILLAAKSGLHAVQVLEEQHVDLVVSDQMMPGMDGVRLLELIRDRWPHCQRVLFTGHASSDVVLGAVNRGGVTKVLTKSMHPVAIRDEIERTALAAPRFAGPMSVPTSKR
jgi:two-component system, cell cycle sensor histidine kinase and response regulator CckA